MTNDLASRLRKLNDAHEADVIDDEMYQASLAKLHLEYGADAVDILLSQSTLAAEVRSHSLTAEGAAQIGVGIAGDVHGNIFYYGKQGKTPDELIRRYLTQVAHDCGVLSLQGMREQKTATDVINISLDQVYTQLATNQPIQRDTFYGLDLQSLDAEAYLRKHNRNLLPYDIREAMVVIFPDEEEDEDEHDNVHQDNENVVGEYWDDIKQHAGVNGQNILTSGPHTISEQSPELLNRYMHVAEELHFFGPQLVTEAIGANSRLVLLGEPGSGKSTALRYLALTLARAGLDVTVDVQQYLEGWQALGDMGRLIPLFMPLLPLAKRMVATSKRTGTEEDLWNQLAETLEPNGANAGLASVIYDALADGRVLLLLDGLDEVASESSRRQVIQAVAAFGNKHRACRIVVTCRVRAYTGERNRAWQLDGWPAVTLADWTLGQMTAFTDAWYTAAVAVGGLAAAKRDERVAALQQAIARRADLQRLGVSPLLLTIMALVHLNDGRLPEDRVTLYNRCIDILLAQWEVSGKTHSDYGALTDYIGLPDTSVKSLRPLLNQAAYLAHSASVPGSPGRLGRAQLRELVMQALADRKHPNPYEGAQRFLAYTDVRTGLLHASDAGDAYVFPHQTFQEYLAGLELVSGVDFVDRIMARRNDDRWHVPILLGMGHLVSENTLAMPHQLLTELLAGEERASEQAQRDALLAAEIADDVGWDRLERGGSSFKKLRRDLADVLAQVVEGTILPAAERVRAGVYLGALGDPRDGVCTLAPAMLPIAGGSFVIGIAPSDEQLVATQYQQAGHPEEVAREWARREVNNQTVRIPAFALARYPVTNAQFKVFITAHGYDPAQSWWDAAGAAWLRADRRLQPAEWANERFGITRPNHPVVGVTWYEALAFCSWLTQTLHDGHTYTLPSEGEWEYAARGTQRRVYPWETDAPDGERAYFGQTEAGTTTVGCFPQGMTSEGVLDMAGNIWEWTRSAYQPYPYDPNDGREAFDNPADKYFTLRGGSWFNQSIYLRASYRAYGTPGHHNDDIGFRLARHRRV